MRSSINGSEVKEVISSGLESPGKDIKSFSILNILLCIYLFCINTVNIFCTFVNKVFIQTFSYKNFICFNYNI